MSRPEEMPDPAPRRRRTLAGASAALVLLFALPLALRLLAIEHDFPRNYVPDTHMVRQALGMARDHDLAPPVGRYSTYPNLLPYLLLPVYLGEYAVGRLTGAWAGAGEFGARLIEDPRAAFLPARLVVASLSTLCVWVVFRAGRAAGLRAGAWVAAWLVATSTMQVHFAVQSRPWGPLTLFLALAVWAVVAYARTPGRRPLVLAGLASGLACATHQAGLPMLGLCGLAWLLAPLGWRGAALRERLFQGVLCVAAFALVALVLGYPQRLLHGATPDAAVAAEGADTISIGGQGILLELRPESFVHLGRALVGYEPVLLLLGLPGLVFALRARATRAPALFALAWGLFFMTQRNDHVRYLLPLTVLLALPAGMQVQAWLARGRAGVTLVALLLALPLVQTLRFVHVLAQEDTRAIAERELPATLGAGMVLAVDRYGPQLDLDLASLERLARVRALVGEVPPLRTREDWRRQRLEAAGDAGASAVFLEELFEFHVRDGRLVVREALRAEYGDTPAEVLRRLGCTHLLFCDRRPGVPELHLLRGLVEGREPLLVIDPSGGDPALDEARLPMEMEFALLNVWRLERPGPRLELYEL